MSAIEFRCPQCKGNLVVDEKGAGVQVNCPECQAKITIPVSEPSSEPDQPAIPLKKKCPSCSANVDSEAVFCSHCGANLKMPTTHGLTLHCSWCGQNLEIPEDTVGNVVNCPSCNRHVKVPYPSSILKSQPRESPLPYRPTPTKTQPAAVHGPQPSKPTMPLKLLTNQDASSVPSAILGTCPRCGRQDVYAICPNCGKTDSFTLTKDGARCVCGNTAEGMQCPYCGAVIYRNTFRKPTTSDRQMAAAIPKQAGPTAHSGILYCLRVLLIIALAGGGIWAHQASKELSEKNKRENTSYTLGQNQMRYYLNHAGPSGNRDATVSLVLRLTEMDAADHGYGFDEEAFKRGCDNEWNRWNSCH
jgi:DNA-directed RNA polymerase subunit M/transcription elongation factor TFIIS